MLVCELKEKLELEYANEGNTNLEVSDCYIGDMLSVVMSKAQEASVWLTVQTNINITAVAALVGLSCIIIVEGIKPQEDTLEKARQQGINILTTDKAAYEVACLINDIL